MRRWLITLFAFHFLVSVGLFAPLSADPGASPQAVVLAADAGPSQLEPSTAAEVAPQAPPEAEQAANDSQGELPECLPWAALHPAFVAVSVLRHAWPLQALRQPVLEGPQRPPRAQTV